MAADNEDDTPVPAGLTVAEMAQTIGITGHTLRYYERAGLIEPITRTTGGQRRYQPANIDWVRFLIRLRETGMPIAQMRHFAALRTQGEATIDDRLTLLAEHRRDVRRQIARLREHEQALAATITEYRQAMTNAQDADTR